MILTIEMTPKQRLEVLFANEETIKSSAGAYGETGESLFNTLASTVITREFEFDFLMAGKTCIWEAIEIAAEKLEADSNPYFYVGNGIKGHAEIQNYFDEQRAIARGVYSRKA